MTKIPSRLCPRNAIVSPIAYLLLTCSEKCRKSNKAGRRRRAGQ